MRWIPLFALAASIAVVSFGAEAQPAANATAPAEEPQLEGVVVERPGGGFLTLTMDGRSLLVRFFDAEKKEIPADVTGGFVRFQFSNRSPERRPLVLTNEGKALRHAEPLRQPYVFKAFITLRRGESEDDVETHVVDFP